MGIIFLSVAMVGIICVEYSEERNLDKTTIITIPAWVSETFRGLKHENSLMKYPNSGPREEKVDVEEPGNWTRLEDEVSSANNSIVEQLEDVNTTVVSSSVSVEEETSLPFCSTDFDPVPSMHTAYADGDWYLEDESAPGASCTVNETAADPDLHHAVCSAPASWDVKPGSARKAAGWGGCPDEVVRECSARGLSEEARVMEAMRWKWRPRGCRLHPFSAHGFLDQLGEKSVIFMIGDSLTADQGEALQCVLPPGEGSRVEIQRHDYLGLTGAPGGERDAILAALKGPDKVATEASLVQHLTQRWKETLGNGGRRPDAPVGTEEDVLQFNAGAHWTLEPAEAKPVFIAVAKAIKASFRGLVLFRTNVMVIGPILQNHLYLEF